ncbi:MAG: CbiX/SirB N-terminal domain-containing protein [Acidobacteria bacterium]|jgi:sirohydrochlorin ferrochelatase|nr:CbiX/SirB N-terminal domain-containing protein [Acidobacteriota bacterium]
MNDVGIILFGHGSRVPEANQSVMAVTEAMRERGGYPLTGTAFLELAEPDLPQAVAALVAQGAHRILVIPYFLTLGIHLRRDLPRIVEDLESIHPGVTIQVTEPLDGHPALLDIVMARTAAALA